MTTNNTFSNQKREEHNTFCNLTEKWKKGELNDGDYYVKTRQGIIIIDYFDVDEFSYDTNHYIEEVLAEVPDYIEWKNYVTMYNYEHEENRQLKGLLKDLRELIGNNFVSSEMRVLLTKIDEVLNVPNE